MAQKTAVKSKPKGSFVVKSGLWKGSKYTYKPKTSSLHEHFAVQAAPRPIRINAEKREAQLASELVDEIAGESNDVQELSQKYDLKREELGRLTGFSLRALAEWASGKLPSQPAKRRLHEIHRLLDALAEIVKPDSIPLWLHQRNEAFDPLTPLQVIELGEIDRLWAMVHDLASGEAE